MGLILFFLSLVQKHHQNNSLLKNNNISSLAGVFYQDAICESALDQHHGAHGGPREVHIGGHGSKCGKFDPPRDDSRDAHHGNRLGPTGVQFHRFERRVHCSSTRNDSLDKRRVRGLHAVLQGLQLHGFLPGMCRRVYTGR
ncbi:DNA-directed RNA polymerase II subunit RPB3 [Caligus rogercresseyi]|uniref:DNA-directed RNA polymerase II subunit RPB3 n=1 Tax=Caligus rogercresseyi TaxID=217165 RepID=A0A7T8KIE3_CALRO|nr:DNA-directed RNA polymerase II subunit RPB3 [Caligus rogercresseyi]